jgi:ketosteroid isomerase-like protein
MRLTALTVGLIVAAAYPVGATQACEAATRTAADAKKAIPADINRFFGDYFKAVEAGDPAGILALIDSDFVIKWPVGQPVSDREQLRGALASLQQRVRQEVQWEVLEASSHGGWAWARVHEKATHFPKAGGSPRTLEGSHLAILRKVRGRWLLHRDHGSLNQWPADMR